MDVAVKEVEATLLSDLVLNDGSSNAPSTAIHAFRSLSRLEEERMAWEAGAHRTSNQQLYDILSECLAFCGELMISEAKKRSAALEKFHKERGYPYRNETPLATRVVRAVFGNVNRRRISTYSLVIRQAQKSKILPTALAEWIESQGGLQEVRMSKSATFTSPAQKVEMGKEYFEDAEDLGLVKSESLSMLADANKVGEPCLLFAEQQDDGGFAIRAVLRQDGLVKAAYQSLYSQLKEEASKQLANAKAANDADGKVAA